MCHILYDVTGFFLAISAQHNTFIQMISRVRMFVRLPAIISLPTTGAYYTDYKQNNYNQSSDYNPNKSSYP